ncbi:MAG: hypothetical protein DRJ69_04920 [Thermoprotei archaeon]|nr:MAG: hypothetical protein DRJ69_04920 [Thermoprotei archaeon]
MSFEEVLRHYSRLEVKEEIARYCAGRWVALEGPGRGERRFFIRYFRDGRPLTISSPSDVEERLHYYRALRPRTVYASINVYARLEETGDVDEPRNVTYTSPIWDVDASLETWREALEAAEVVVSWLEKHGVERSVFLKWSGRGVHIHVHERAFSPELLARHHPLDLAFAVVEFTLRSVKDELKQVASRAPVGERALKVENKVDAKRVFTAPLSLHRVLDLCCVCFKPNDLRSFNPDWAKPGQLRHDKSWSLFEEGEGDELALEALKAVGGYDGWPGAAKRAEARTVVEAEVPTATAQAPLAKLGRFQVMGLLQAARYYLITGDLEKAKSFGLNRAVFYAWAKRYARDRLVQARRPSGQAGNYEGERRVELLGDEGAYVSKRGWFAIGAEEQTPQDYDRQVARRIDAVVPYEEAWRAALDYLKSFPRAVLLDQQRFYNEAYKPIRDDFLSVVQRSRRAGRQATLDQLFGG